MDPLIQLLRERPDVLDLLGRIWEILYIEGSSLDVGKRRENAIRLLLEKELGLKVIAAPSTTRGWDFKVRIGRYERTYSLKTLDRPIDKIKIAWNGFPSIERARRFEFRYPILFVSRDRNKAVISVYVFEEDDLESLREELGDKMWWIPKKDRNPRGFGLSITAVRRLIERAKEKGNYVSSRYKPIDRKKVEAAYWNRWYSLLKDLATS